MLDSIDQWMDLDERKWREETSERSSSPFMYSYPDTLLIESLTDRARSDIRRLSAYLHHTTPTQFGMKTRSKDFLDLGLSFPV